MRREVAQVCCIHAGVPETAAGGGPSLGWDDSNVGDILFLHKVGLNETVRLRKRERAGPMVLRKPVLRAGWLLSSHPDRVAPTRAGAATRLRSPRAPALGGDWGGALSVQSKSTRSLACMSQMYGGERAGVMTTRKIPPDHLESSWAMTC